jgi:thymidylate synthase (FAD)
MKDTKHLAIPMKVTLIAYTPDPERLAAAAARQCYSRYSATRALENMSPDDITKQLKKVIGNGHLSTLEHVSFTFSIEGISRACSHQLVRHRIASYSQQSMRYVKFEEIDFIIPGSIAQNEKALIEYNGLLKKCKECYQSLQSIGIPTEDARYVLPQASPTKIVMTMNVRSLLNFFELRCCLRAQWEIRELACEMLRLVKAIAPTIFENAGPACIDRKICPEKVYDCPKWVELYKKGKP